MNSPYGGIPLGQSPYSGMGQPGGVDGGRGDGGGLGSAGRSERLPNFILSSGYTPPSRVGVMESEKASPKDMSSILFGVSETPKATSDVRFNERLRGTSRGGDGASGSGAIGNGMESKTPFRDVTMPQNSILDEHSPGPIFSPHESRGTSAVGSDTKQRNRLEASVVNASGGGLFDFDRRTVGVGQTPTSAPQTRGAFTSPSMSPLDHSESDASGRWVTIFGFGPSMQSLVLREFRNHGDIVQHISGKGNWIHIQYRTALQAQVALSRKVRVIGGETMVGVLEYSEDGVNLDQSISERTPRGLASPASNAAMTPVHPPEVGTARSGASHPSPSTIMKTPRPRKSFWQSPFGQ